MGSLEGFQSGGIHRKDTPPLERHWQNMQLPAVASHLKPLLLFPAQILCAFLLVLFPVALHLLHTKATGYEYLPPVFSDLNFVGDWFEMLCVWKRDCGGDGSLGGRLFRVMGISVHILANSLMWPLCTHVAASCLLGANPPLIQSLKAALHASKHVLAMFLPPFLHVLLPTLIASVIVWLTGYKAPPSPPESEDTELWVVPSLILICLFAAFINSFFGFASVMASLRPDVHDTVMQPAGTAPRTCGHDWRAAVPAGSNRLYLGQDKFGRMLMTGCEYAVEYRFILFVLHLQFYVPHLDYLKFWVDVEERNLVSVAWAMLSITVMAALKVYIIVYICALCLHKRAAHVEAGLDSDPSKVMAPTKIWTPFDADNKSTILVVVAAFDGALAMETLSSYHATPCKTFPV